MIEVLKSDVGCVDSAAHRSVPHFLSQRLSLPRRPWAPTKKISVRVGIALVRVGNVAYVADSVNSVGVVMGCSGN